jgi:hypothetical protein
VRLQGQSLAQDTANADGERLSRKISTLIVILLIVQIWLLSATLESYLAGHREAALPAAIISGILFAACLGLYRFVDRIDSGIRRG